MIAGKAVGSCVDQYVHIGRPGGGHTPGADECANLAHSGGETVELAAHSGGAGLGGEQTKTVARTELTKAQENAIDDGKCANVVRELLIEAAHDEADDGLAEQAGDHGVLRAEVVDDERADDRAGHVEQAED